MKLMIGGMLMWVTACEPANVELQPTDPQLGERTYQKCYSCHALDPRKSDLTGPTLYRIVGRPIAVEPGFEYSAAMRKFGASEGRWERQLLDKFIADPEALVPGTSMTFSGISDPEERAALIDYLERDQTSAKAASLP